MDNIKYVPFSFRYQAAVKKYGVPQEEIFQTADLFERRNISQVTLSILALGRIVRIRSTGFIKKSIDLKLGPHFHTLLVMAGKKS